MSVSAKVTLTVTVNCRSNWGDDTTMAQIVKQANEDAIGFIHNLPHSIDERDRGRIAIHKDSIKVEAIAVKT